MTKTPSRTQVVLARLVVEPVDRAVIVGLLMYGLSGEVVTRIWRNVIERPGGPFVFRFVLQPIMAMIAALRDGIDDARMGRAPFLWTVRTDPTRRSGRLDEVLIATSRIILLGLAIDTIYQFVEFETYFSAVAGIIALLLAFIPYLVPRGLVTRIARRWVGDESANAKP